MTTFRSEEALVGIIALAAVGWIAWIIRRGLRDLRLPIGRGHVDRAERPDVFHALTAFYIAAALLMAFIGLDLLIGITS